MKQHVRSIVLALALLVASAAPPLSAQAQAGRIAFINVQQIMTQAPGVAEARATLQKEAQTVEQQATPELRRMQSELDTLQAQFQRQQATLTEAARQQRQQDFQQKAAAFQQRQQQFQQQLQRREQELLAPITQRIEQTIEQIRKEGNYAMIFDTGQGGIVAADQTLDLTNRVLDRLKTSAPAPAAR